MRLIEERRQALDAAITVGGETSEAEIDAALAAKGAELAARGYGA